MSKLQCLVIMPFRAEFDPVYKIIRDAVATAVPNQPIDCYWLKDVHAAGRISDDILHSIQSAALCVADLTGNNPNVMWETGYAMALGKPTVLVSQDVDSLPFDLKLHRVHPYQSGALDALTPVLIRAVGETLTRYGLAPRRWARLPRVRWRGAVLVAAVLLALLLYPITTWWQHRERLSEARAAIERQNLTYRQVVADADPDGYTRLFTDDGVILSNGQLVRGQEEILDFTTKHWMGGSSPVIQTVKTDVRNDLAYEVGFFTRGESNGSYLTVWKKKSNGEWGIQAEANSVHYPLSR